MPTVDHRSLVVSRAQGAIAILARAITCGEEALALKAAGDEDGAYVRYRAMCALQAKCSDEVNVDDMLADDLIDDLRNAEASVLDLVAAKLLDEDLQEGEAETVRAFFALIKEIA